jgi:hypothetical protein
MAENNAMRWSNDMKASDLDCLVLYTDLAKGTQEGYS